VIAVVRDGGSTWYNPAKLGGTDRDRLDMTASVYSVRWSRAPGFMRTTNGDANDVREQEFVAVPSQISYVRKLNERTALELAYHAPRAASMLVRQQLQSDEGTIAADWYVDGLHSYKEYIFGGILGMRLRNGLRLGGGLRVRRESLEQSVDFIGQVAIGGTVSRLLQASTLSTRDQIGIEPTLGIQWEVTPSLTLAASARGPRLGPYIAGEDTASESFVLGDTGAPQLFTYASAERFDHKPFSLVRLGRYFLGAAHRRGPLLLAIDGDLQPGLVDEGAGIERKHAWNVCVGATRRVSQRFTLGTGVFTDRGADRKNEEGFLSAGANFVGGSLGLRHDDEHRLAAGETSDSLRFASIFAIRYAYARSKLENLTFDPAGTTI